jgi:hypothetical protein
MEKTKPIFELSFIPVDKKQLYTENTDKYRRTLIFTFPNVKSGSVIEFNYKWSTYYSYNYPDWYFQSNLPCRYSEVDAGLDNHYLFK